MDNLFENGHWSVIWDHPGLPKEVRHKKKRNLSFFVHPPEFNIVNGKWGQLYTLKRGKK